MIRCLFSDAEMNKGKNDNNINNINNKEAPCLNNTTEFEVYLRQLHLPYFSQTLNQHQGIHFTVLLNNTNNS